MSIKERFFALQKEALCIQDTTQSTFSRKMKDWLGKKQYTIISLTGKSYRELMDISPVLFPADESNWLKWIDQNIIDYPSERTEVAFDPNRFILPSSDNLPIEDQLITMEEEYKLSMFSHRHTDYDILSFPSYMDLFSQYYQKTGKHLLKKGITIRTATVIENSYQNCNITFDEEEKIIPSFSYRTIGWKGTFISPVFMPRK